MTLIRVLNGSFTTLQAEFNMCHMPSRVKHVWNLQVKFLGYPYVIGQSNHISVSANNTCELLVFPCVWLLLHLKIPWTYLKTKNTVISTAYWLINILCKISSVNTKSNNTSSLIRLKRNYCIICILNKQK